MIVLLIRLCGYTGISARHVWMLTNQTNRSGAWRHALPEWLAYPWVFLPALVIRCILRSGAKGESGVKRQANDRGHIWQGLGQRRGKRHSRGQALVEFALIAPIFFLLIFGVIEFSVINAAIGAYNFAAKDAARLGAIKGPTDANIDQEIITLVNSHVNDIPAAQPIEIDIFQADSFGQPTGKLDAYAPNGTAIGSPSWPYTIRNDGQVSLSSPNSSPYLGVRILYHYTYLTAFVSSTGAVLSLTATAVFRIEPQEFSSMRAGERI